MASFLLYLHSRGVGFGEQENPLQGLFVYPQLNFKQTMR